MKIQDRFKAAVKFVISGQAPSVLHNILTTGVMRRNSAERDYYGNFSSWAWFAIDKIAERVASIDFELYQMKKDGSVEEVEDHEILNLIDRPNPLMTKRMFFKLVSAYYKIWGSCPIYVYRVNGKPKELWPMRPDMLQMTASLNSTPTSWKYTVGMTIQNFQPDEVCYIYNPDLRDPMRGSGSFRAIALELDMDAAAAVWNKYYFENNAEPSGVLQTDSVLDDKVFERLKRQWEARYGGPENAGKAAILEHGLKYQSISTTGKESGYLETRNYSRDAIITMLGLPKGLYLSDNVNLANAEVAERTYMSETIDPLMGTIAEHLDSFLTHEFGDNLWLTYESPVREDRTLMLEEAKVGVNVWMTPNEVRAAYNMAPIEGGDELQKGNTAPQSPPVKRLKSAPIPLRKQAKIRKKINQKTFERRKIEASVKGMLDDKLGNHIEETVRKMFTVREVGESFVLSDAMNADRKDYLTRSDKRKGEFKKKLDVIFSAQEKALKRKLEEVGPYKKSLVDWIDGILSVFLNTELSKLFKDEHTIGIQDGAVAIAAALNKPGIDIMSSPEVVDFLKKMPNKLAGEVNDTTMAALRATLSEASGNTESIVQMSKRISDVFSQAQSYRSDRIALTEVGRAENFGRISEMSAQGVEKKVWLATGINTRPDHMAVNGQVVGVKDTFDVGGYTAMAPGDGSLPADEVCNCRCSVYPYATLD